jgi:hypothetical protein
LCFSPCSSLFLPKIMSRKTRVSASLKGVIRKNGINFLALLIAVPALSYSLLINTPLSYVQSAENMFASAASMSAVVPANPDNMLAAQLADKEAQLNQREQEIAARTADQSRNGSLGETLGVSSFFISIILLGLVSLNFYYDSRRAKSSLLSRKFSVDLR